MLLTVIMAMQGSGFSGVIGNVSWNGSNVENTQQIIIGSSTDDYCWKVVNLKLKSLPNLSVWLAKQNLNSFLQSDEQFRKTS